MISEDSWGMSEHAEEASLGFKDFFFYFFSVVIMAQEQTCLFFPHQAGNRNRASVGAST